MRSNSYPNDETILSTLFIAFITHSRVGFAGISKPDFLKILMPLVRPVRKITH